jgi:ferric-dicitrate binding protein FerR (iron transport regulator)
VTLPILVFIAVIPAAAQAPAGRPNHPGVARVTFIRGHVTIQRGDSGDFSSVALNTPLVAGDKVTTGNASRTELQLDCANILRLDENAQATIATLGSNRLQVQVSQGLTNYSVLMGSQVSVEIDTPNVSIHPVRGGRYRVQVNSDGDTLVTVNDGEAQVSASEGSTTVNKDQLITVRGTAAEAQYRVTEVSQTDDWDNWNRDRDNIIYNASSYRVIYGWAPYRPGWVWAPYWGWGWAPYRYGRWFLSGGSWVWWPGPIYLAHRPIR